MNNNDTNRSSWIDRLTFDLESKVATMETSSGYSYFIDGMTHEGYENWVSSPSLGRFFNQSVLGNYAITRTSPVL